MRQNGFFACRVISKEEENEDGTGHCLSGLKRFFSDEDSVSSLSEKETQSDSLSDSEDMCDASGCLPSYSKHDIVGRDSVLRVPMCNRDDLPSRSSTQQRASVALCLTSVTEAPRITFEQTDRALSRTADLAAAGPSSGPGSSLHVPKMRFLRSASAPAIHATCKARMPRALSLAPDECVLSRTVLNRNAITTDCKATFDNISIHGERLCGLARVFGLWKQREISACKYNKLAIFSVARLNLS